MNFIEVRYYRCLLFNWSDSSAELLFLRSCLISFFVVSIFIHEWLMTVISLELTFAFAFQSIFSPLSNVGSVQSNESGEETVISEHCSRREEFINL